MNIQMVMLALNVLPPVIEFVESHPSGADVWKMATGDQSGTFWKGMADFATSSGHTTHGLQIIQAVGAIAPILGRVAPAHPNASSEPLTFAKAVEALAAVAPIILKAIPQDPAPTSAQPA